MVFVRVDRRDHHDHRERADRRRVERRHRAHVSVELAEVREPLGWEVVHENGALREARLAQLAEHERALLILQPAERPRPIASEQTFRSGLHVSHQRLDGRAFEAKVHEQAADAPRT